MNRRRILAAMSAKGEEMKEFVVGNSEVGSVDAANEFVRIGVSGTGTLMFKSGNRSLANRCMLMFFDNGNATGFWRGEGGSTLRLRPMNNGYDASIQAGDVFQFYEGTDITLEFLKSNFTPS